MSKLSLWNMVFMVIIACQGCTTIAKTNLEKDSEVKNLLYQKDFGQILAILQISKLDEENITFIGEPPCSLHSVILNSKKFQKKIEIEFSNLDKSLVFSPTCSWNVGNYLNYIPSYIGVLKK